MRSKKELLKSFGIGIISLILLTLWLISQPRLPETNSQKLVGQKLLPDFSDPALIGEISILKYQKLDVSPDVSAQQTPQNESNSTDSWKKESILLKEQDNHWVIADYSAFPAENSEQMAKLLSPLFDLTILSVALDAETLMKSHDDAKIDAFYRAGKLLDPEKAMLSEANETGVSLKILGKNEEVLVQLIIGNQAEESSAVRDIRYVRVPNGTVYLVDFSTASKENSSVNQSYWDALSTDPLDWMNRDILQISRWNIKRLSIHDYSMQDPPQPNSQTPKFNDKSFVSNGFFSFDQDPTNSLERVWSLVQRLNMNDSGKYEAVDFSSEAANNTKINEIVDLLGHLNLVDIQRKSDFLATLFRENRSFREAVQRNESLESLGFYLADYNLLQPDDPQPEPNWLGERGGMELLMNDGTTISLCFGSLQEDKRALLVSAKFDEKASSPPELLPIKEISEEATPEEKSKIEAENRDAETENSLRKSEHLLNKAEGKKKAKEKNDRWANWFYFINESDFQKLNAHSSDVFTNK